MGDRGNIVIEKDSENFPHEVYFYTHWGGSDLKQTLQKALTKGRVRWGDGAYLSRVIFCEMVGDNKGITGFGITTAVTDHEHPLLCVNMKEGKVKVRASETDPAAPVTQEWTFQQFIDANHD